MLHTLRRWCFQLVLSLLIALAIGDQTSDLYDDDHSDDWAPEQHQVAVVDRYLFSICDVVVPPEQHPADIKPSLSAGPWPRFNVRLPANFSAGVDPPPVNLI